MIKNTTNQKQKGYAILFTVVMVSVISAIALGIANSTYKQQILSSITKDSIIAFYQADTAADCALYADLHSDLSTMNLWSCGSKTNGTPYDLKVTNTISGNLSKYFFNPNDGFIGTNPCFSFEISKDTSTGVTVTKIKARGFSICNTVSLRAVEREIDINY